MRTCGRDGPAPRDRTPADAESSELTPCVMEPTAHDGSAVLGRAPRGRRQVEGARERVGEAEGQHERDRTPSVFEGEECGGVSIEVTNARTVEPVRVGLAIAVALRKLYPTDWKGAGVMTLLGNKQVFEAIMRGDEVPKIVTLYEKDLESFGKRRGPFLLYP